MSTLPIVPNFSQMTDAILDTQRIDLLIEIDKFNEETSKILNSESNSGLRRLQESLYEFSRFSRACADFIYQDKQATRTEKKQILEKIQDEILALRPLVEQRRTELLAPYLQVADTIANDFLQRCNLQANIPEVFNTKLTVKDKSLEERDRSTEQLKGYCLTFFETTHFISLSTVYYSRCGSIGIPLANWNKPWLWLGLVHEVGHYIYWNQRLLKAKIENTVMNSLSSDFFTANNNNNQISRQINQDLTTNVEAFQLWSNWIEEVFADIFGALALGPSYVESLIAWMLPQIEKLDDLFVDDKDHPIRFLRPLIQLGALEKFIELTEDSSSVTANGQTINQLKAEIVRLRNSWLEYCNTFLPAPARSIAKSADPLSPISTYWQKQFVRETDVQIERLLLHIPKIIEALFVPSIPLSPIKFGYTPQTHETVIKLATDLAAGKASEKSDELPIGFALSVAWYAWRYAIASNGANGAIDEGELVNRLGKWLGEKMGTGSSIIEAPAHSIGSLQKETSKPFDKLVDALRADNKSESEIKRHILSIEFSSQRGQGGCGVGYYCCQCCKNPF